VGLGVIATLTLVGVAWKQITGALRYAQPEVTLRPAGKLATLPARRTGNVKDWPLEASQVFAALPETELRESPLQTSSRLLKDTTPLAGVQNGAIQVLPALTLISSAEGTLRPVRTIRKMDVREIAKLPIDPNEERKARNQPIDTSVAGQVTVTASYYGKELAGRRTASGEKFNPSGMTAAHRTLPFGTLVRVTHSRNGRSVTVRINDRGPFIKGRSIDLSAGAAAAIGMGGTGRVHLKVLR
jgi:hypothetical protein